MFLHYLVKQRNTEISYSQSNIMVAMLKHTEDIKVSLIHSWATLRLHDDRWYALNRIIQPLVTVGYAHVQCSPTLLWCQTQFQKVNGQYCWDIYYLNKRWLTSNTLWVTILSFHRGSASPILARTAVQLVQRKTVNFICPELSLTTVQSWTHWLQDLWSNIAAYVWVMSQ